MSENERESALPRPGLPGALARAQVVLASGPATLDGLVDELGRHGFRMKPTALLRYVARYPDVFVRLVDGRVGLVGMDVDDEAPPSDADDDHVGWWTLPPATPVERVSPSDVVVLDISTTGLSRDDDYVTEIAAATLDGARSFEVAVRHPGAHGDERVPLADALERLHSFVGSARAWAGHHVADFDVPFLQIAAKRAEATWDVDLPSIDLHELSLVVDPSAPGRTLGELCEAVGVDVADGAAAHVGATVAAIHAYLAMVDAADPNWALTIRVLDEGRAPVAMLLPDAVPVSTLAPAFERPADPLSCRTVDRQDAVSAEAATDATFDALNATDGHRERPPQRLMARHVASALDGGNGLAVEAPTGTGKSLAYLVAASEWAARTGRTAVIATHTKVLQRQLRDDARRLADLGLLRVPFRQLFGVSNYVCVRELTAILGGRELHGSEWLAAAVAVRSVVATTNGVWDDVTDGQRARVDPGYSQARAALRASANTCEGSGCEFVTVCPAYRHRREAARDGASVLSVNHALIATWIDAAGSGGASPGSPLAAEDDPAVRPPAPAVVFDEAHTLEDSLTSAWTTSVGSLDLRILVASIFGRHGAVRAIRRAVRKTGRGGDEATAVERRRSSLSTAIGELNAAAGVYLHEFGGAGHQAELRRTTVRARPEYRAMVAAALVCDGMIGGLQSDLIAVDGALVDGDDVPAEVVRARFRIRAAITELTARRECLQALGSLDDQHRFVDVLGVSDRVGDEVALGDVWEYSRIPIRIDERFSTDVVDRMHATVLTSATLRVAKSFDFLERRLGIGVGDGKEFAELVVDSPFDHDRQSAVILTSHLPLPIPGAEREFCEDLAADQVGLMSLTKGRMLTLFAARNRMEAVAERVREHEHALAERGVEVLVQHDGTIAEITTKFKKDTGAVLYGLRSFWEGFDAPGDTLGFLVIEKPPYPHPGDPVAAARQRAITDEGGDAFIDYVVPRTAIAMAQGFGRLIRREDDRGVAIMCDRRLRNPSRANDILLNTLPTTNVIEADDRDDAWTKAIEFVDGVTPDLSDAIVVGDTSIDETLRELQILPGENPRPKLAAAASRLFGIDELRDEQFEVMEAILAGRDALGFLPTGFGKSICFQLPALLHPEPRPTVVVSPLIALIKDQVDDLRGRRGLRMVRGITGQTTMAEQGDTLEELARGNVRLVYVSPERLVRDGKLSTSLKDAQLNALVVDEAHCVSTWGHDFRPEYRQVVKPILDFERSPRVGMTATATPTVEEDLDSTLRMDDPLVVRSAVDRPDIRYWVRQVADERDRCRELLRFVMFQGPRPGIVYASRRAVTEEVAWLLRQVGVAARSYHAGMVPEQRDAVQEDFLAGVTQVIVATKAFGMGINKPDIGWVAHFDVPDSLEGYAQEAGRAARSPGIDGDALLLFHKRDLARRWGQAGKSSLDRDGLAQRVVRLISETPVRDGLHTFDAEDLADRAGLDVNELNVIVSWLERVDALERMQDCTVRGVVGLGRREPEDTEERRRFVKVVRFSIGAAAGKERRIVLAEVADDVGVPVAELERDLTRWSLQRFISYRSTTRAWQVAVKTPVVDTAALSDVVERWRTMERERVAQISTYTSTNECRRTSIARTFGDPLTTCATSGGRPCDVCSGTEPYWYAVPLDSVPDPDGMIDLELVVLQAVRWSTWGIESGRTQRYSEANLLAAVTGTERIGDRPLPNRLLNCPQFGAARYVRSKESLVKTATAGLVDAGLVVRDRVEYGGTSYDSLRLTDVGLVRLGVPRG